MKIRYSILAGLVFALIMFIYLAFTGKMDIAILISVFIFVISPFLFYFKVFSKVNFSESFPKIDKKAIIYSGLSSRFQDGITVGGTLYLLNDRLIFQTNLINFIKRHQHTILLNQITQVEIVNSIGFISNGLLIKSINDNDEKFVVTEREIWKEQIDKLINLLRKV